MRSGVVLDLDGTLLDRRASITSYANRFWLDFERHIRVPKAEFVERFLALDGDGYADRRRFFSELARYLDCPALAAERIAGHFAELAWCAPELAAEAAAGCRRLRAAGIPVGIVTNGSSSSQRSKLRNSGLDRVVDHCVISEELGVKKPDSAIFREICDRLAIDPASSWFVGDHPEIDIVGASRFGFRTIWIRGAIVWPEDQPRCCTAAVDSLAEAFAVIGEHTASLSGIP